MKARIPGMPGRKTRLPKCPKEAKWFPGVKMGGDEYAHEMKVLGTGRSRRAFCATCSPDIDRLFPSRFNRRHRVAVHT
jgi:hypothetical protein